jgi:hypothetical protein
VTEAVAKHQRLVREVGKKLEANVWRILNDTLNKKRIYAFNVADIRRWTGRNHSMKRLIDYVKVSINNACWQDQTTTLPDTDNLVVYKQDDAGADLINWHPLAIISCKTSFHARETESLFWALQVRPKKIPYVLVTEDSNRYNLEPTRRNTELGTCEERNRIRTLVESFLDRVYIIKKYGVGGNDIVKDIERFHSVFERAESSGYRGIESFVFDDAKKKPHAGYCKFVRPFDDLLFDLMKWKFEKLG